MAGMRSPKRGVLNSWLQDRAGAHDPHNTGGRCRPQRAWGRSSLPLQKELGSAEIFGPMAVPQHTETCTTPRHHTSTRNLQEGFAELTPL